MSSRSVRSGNGRGVGTLRRKEESRDKSSARSLAIPAIYTTDNENPSSASIRNMQRRRCISPAFLLDRLAITCTTASLSQCALTCCPCQALPHTAADTITAKSSLKAIPSSRPCGHSHCHQCSPHQAPQPHPPEASEANSTVGTGVGGNNATPFHVPANAFHQ